MNVVFLGPPGCGKGTQAERIEAGFGIRHVSTGALLREAMAAGHPLALKAKEVMDAGGLVDDEIVVALLDRYISEIRSSHGFIFDGFPRTVAQARLLDDLLARHGQALDLVVMFQVPDEMIVDRISGRFSCATCGTVYHERYTAPRIEGVCDRCASLRFICREDDNPASVRARLVTYHRLTEPLLPYYEREGKLRRIDATQDIKDVALTLRQLLGLEDGG